MMTREDYIAAQIDAAQAAWDDVHGDFDYHAGPDGIGPDDRYDSRGERLLPAVNEGGEPYWM